MNKSLEFVNKRLSERGKETLKKEKLAFKSFLYYHDGLSFLLKKDLNYILLCSNAEKEYLK